MADLEECIRRGAKGLLKDVALFDIYTGTGIPEGKKSVAFNLTLRADDRSLTAEEADADGQHPGSYSKTAETPRCAILTPFPEKDAFSGTAKTLETSHSKRFTVFKKSSILIAY